MSNRPDHAPVARWEWAALIAILVLAGATRLLWPGLTEFKADEARLLTLALQTSQGDVAVHGIASSVGFPNAPMSVWLYALPLALWRHPYAPTLFVGLLNTLAVGGVYWLARRYWGVPAAMAAALLLAAGPWAILFSRKIWAQNLLPLFAVGWAISASLALVEGRRPFIALHLLCLAVLVQLHPAAVALAPATAVYLLVFRRQVAWRWFALGVALGALTTAPFLWHLWGRYTAGGLPFSTGQAAAELSPDSIRLALAAVAGTGVEAVAGPGVSLPPGLTVVHWAWAGMVVAGAILAAVALARGWSRPSSWAGLIVLCWFLFPALFFVWHRTPVYVHYFIAGLPAACLLAGVGFGRLIEWVRPPLRLAAWSLLLLTVALQLAVWGSVLRTAATHPTAGGFGIPLRAKLAAAEEIRIAIRANGATEALLVGDGSDPETDYFPAEFRALLHDVAVRYVDLNAEAVFPAGASVALVDMAAADGPTSVRALYAAAAVATKTIPTAPDASYTVYSLPPDAAPPAEVSLPPALLANFARLTGHNGLRATPDGLLWDVYWTTADNPDLQSYHFFNHLLEAGGGRVAQADGAAFAGQQWQTGDVVISRFLLPAVPEAERPLTMRVGMYRFPSLDPVPVLDAAANPAADAIEIRLPE